MHNEPLTTIGAGLRAPSFTKPINYKDNETIYKGNPLLCFAAKRLAAKSFTRNDLYKRQQHESIYTYKIRRTGGSPAAGGGETGREGGSDPGQSHGEFSHSRRLAHSEGKAVLCPILFRAVQAQRQHPGS